MNALQKVKNDFSYNRQSAQQKAKAALDFALQNEDFNKLYKAEKELTISIAKKEFSGENADLLTSELAKNKLTQNEVLKTLNLNPDISIDTSLTDPEETANRVVKILDTYL